MTVDFHNFLDLLAAYMAGAAQVAYASTPRGLWIDRAVEKDAAAVYSVLRIYGGAVVPVVPVLSCSIQCMTTGQPSAAWSQAVKLFGALSDDKGRPLRMKVLSVGGVNKFRINGVDLRMPGSIGTDERGREQVSFNFEARIVPMGT